MGDRFVRYLNRYLGGRSREASAGDARRASEDFDVVALEQHPLERLLGPQPRLTLGGPGPGRGLVARARRRDSLARWALAMADMAAAGLALTLAIVVLGGDRVSLALVAGIPLVVIVSKIIGLYDRDQLLVRKSTLDEAPALFQVAALFTLLIWLGEGALIEESTTGASDTFGNTQVIGLWGLLFVSMLSGRALVREGVKSLTASERCIVLGSADSARHITEKFSSARSADAVVLGRVPLEPGERFGDGPPVLGQIDELADLISRHRVERVIIAPTHADSEQLLDAIKAVKALGVKVSVLPRLFEVVGSSVIFDDVEGLVLLGVPQWGLTRSSMMLKRSVDMLGSGLGLLLLAPLFATIALAVKLTSRGPVFYRSARVGRCGEEFEMLKFRTMFDGAERQKDALRDRNEADGALFKIDGDPRKTSVGRVLRRCSLDELPQLVNVLRGEMSLVGPRPLEPDEDRCVEGLDRRRLDVVPGMTGIWQVLGSPEHKIPLNEMVKIDYLYGANWSLWLDIKILMRTFPHMVGRRGL